ncbi:MAG: hypothetical protein WKG06_39165 [Segetibacter sp.]
MTPLKKMSELENDNLLVVYLNEEKHLLYRGDDTTDMTEASIQQSWPEEKSVWDDV